MTSYTTSPDPGIWPYGEPLRLVATETLGGSRCPHHPDAHLEGDSPRLYCPDGGGHAVYRTPLPDQLTGRAS